MKKILSLLALLLVALSGAAQRGNNMYGVTDPELINKLVMAQVYISNLYVDTVDQKKLVENAINGMLENLDPHSAYSNPEDTKKLNEPLAGNFEGIGVQFNMLEDTLVVLQTIAQGPSERAGIVAGDRIVTVDGDPIAGVKMDRDSIMHRLRGPKDTKVRLGIVRRGVGDVLYFTVKRDKIPLNTIDATYMLRPGVGYIRLERFGSTSGEEVKKAIQTLQKQGMKSLVLDLEDNGGGYLGAASAIASQFLERGQLVVYTEGLSQRKEVFNAEGGGLFTEGRLIVLVDEYTASAAEIVSGAVQDHDRGTIIGRRTFGKGLVQRPIDLPDGSMIRLTTSHYYTPSGRCIQKPYKLGDKKSYSEDINNRFTHGELSCLDSIHLDSTKVFRTLRDARPVYGGGGIMPDIFVPLDTMVFTKYLKDIRRRNIIVPEMLRFCDQNRKDIRKTYKTYDDFAARYQVPQALTDTIMAQAEREGVKPADEAEREKTLPDLQWLLKSLVIYNLWDRTEYYRFINERNDIIKAALKELGLE